MLTATLLLFSHASAQPFDLKVEYLRNPVVVSTTRPRFSWKVKGADQSAYEIVVTDGSKQVWDSGKVVSEQQLFVPYGGPDLAPASHLEWQVRLWSDQDRPGGWSDLSTFGIGLLSDGDWHAKWLSDNLYPKGAETLPPVRLRREFSLGKPIRRATLYTVALGAYEARINGRKVGDTILTPEWTDFNKRVLEQGYDVTRLVKKGRNALAATVGDGWYAGRLGMLQGLTGHLPRYFYGSRPKFRALLRVEYKNGEISDVATDETWKTSANGPIRSSDIYDGETQDLRLTSRGWDKPGYAEKGWTAADVVDNAPIEIKPQPSEPIRVVKELRPVRLTEPKPGVYVFDLGQNMVGWPRIDVTGATGANIQIRHAEVLNGDGTIYVDNLRGAPCIDHYILAGGGRERLEPHFTYHGFRYVEVTGPIAPMQIGDLLGRAFCTSAKETSVFQCSNPMLNRLFENIRWTQRANLMGIPTDCPQRDERLGWMGDITAFAQTSIFNMEMNGFFAKWFPDIRDAQDAEGRFSDISPSYLPGKRFRGVAAWGDAGVVVPWRAWRNYGDKDLIASHFDAVKKWVDHIDGENPDHIWAKDRNNDYGDWLNGDTLVKDGWPRKGGEVPKEIFATAFFYQSTSMASQMAHVLGNPSDEQKYAALATQIKEAFQAKYIDADAKMPGDTQAGYALALEFGLVPADKIPAARKLMLAALDRYQGRMSTGFLTSLMLMRQLTEMGSSDAAYKLVTTSDFPSWGFMVSNGATTIWERWDGYVKGRGFQDAGMNSFNHWAFGSVGQWMMNSILGIDQAKDSVAWSKIVVKPIAGGGLDHASGSYDSPRGLIKSAWKLSGDRMTVDVTIPYNTTAEIYVKGAEGKPTRTEGEWSVFQVGGGNYHYTGRP